MNFQELYKTLAQNKYYIFSYGDILLFYPNEKKLSLKKAIHRWSRKGWVYPLKRGLYELIYPKELILDDMFVANKLYSPSYVSFETALSNYSIIPEVSMAVTSVTTKPTRKFKNKHGLFTYRTVKKEAFTGYYVEKHRSFDILIAEPEKALIDYLYFKTYRSKKFDIKEERLDKEVISKLSKKKIEKYARLYAITPKELHAYI